MGEDGATHGGAGRAGTCNVRNVVSFSWDHVVKTCSESEVWKKWSLYDSKEQHGLGNAHIEVVGRCEAKNV